MNNRQSFRSWQEREVYDTNNQAVIKASSEGQSFGVTSSHRVILDTRMRDVTAFPSFSRCTVKLPDIYRGVKEIRLLSAYVPLLDASPSTGTNTSPYVVIGLTPGGIDSNLAGQAVNSLRGGRSDTNTGTGGSSKNSLTSIFNGAIAILPYNTSYTLTGPKTVEWTYARNRKSSDILRYDNALPSLDQIGIELFTPDDRATDQSTTFPYLSKRYLTGIDETPATNNLYLNSMNATIEIEIVAGGIMT